MKKVLVAASFTLISLLSACSTESSQNVSEPSQNSGVSSNPQQDGEEFLTKKKSEAGVKTLASGLMYKVIKSGTGKTPKLTDSVTTHYRGTFINGKEFDSSYSRNEPTTFPVNGVIKGWTEALQLMKEGDKWELYIPSNLAYGEAGNSPVIPPNSALVFELDLIKVN
ncbi:FKBP-type peptidyl-prolyl cis-trans isomerase [bacterium]|nr:MAG: FKBP-type peptidyl-prolyl cis-trans isomerase [bacterium]